MVWVGTELFEVGDLKRSSATLRVFECSLGFSLPLDANLIDTVGYFIDSNVSSRFFVIGRVCGHVVWCSRG
jgi:hypothetical protein